MKIILATTSPYRIEAFKFLEIDFTAEGSKVDESQVERNNPEDLVRELSKLKAEAVAKNHKDAIVIGMDSAGYFNDQDKFYNTYALGYASLGHYSSTFAETIEGSYYNFLRGIPLEIIPDLINNAIKLK